LSDHGFLLYGANGFTGKLIAERAKERGLSPILAGRNVASVEKLARELALPFRVFDLADPKKLREAISGVGAVLHAAGPYSATSRPMVDACLAERVHYLDITGEISVLEAVLARNAEAQRAGITLLPAVGFDVVPTDCMAATLAAALPDAIRLDLAFTGGMLPSPGTAKTAVEGIQVGALVRENGEITALKGPRTREVPFSHGAKFCMSIPWGDLVTAFHSTGIPNIAVYTVVPRAVATAASFLRFGIPIFRSETVVKFLQKRVEAKATGPTAAQRKSGRMAVWGRIQDAKGTMLEGHLDLPEGYELTVLASVSALERVLRGEVPPGATTPSKAFGANFVTTLPGVGAFRVAPVAS
jgi:short subunit dehydrogenase-like uncharacterized protein